MKHLPILAAALLTAAVSAQTSTFTSPRGLDTKEGSSSHGYVLGSEKNLRWQQMDPTQVGNPAANIKSIAWRRDSSAATSTNYGARTFVNMSVIMAHTNASNASTNYAGNYVGSPTVVFTAKNVSAPDWSNKPTATPAPFSLKLVYDTPWTYNGTDDLLWEVRVADVTPFPTAFTNYPYDFDRVGPNANVRRVYQYGSTSTSHTINGANYGKGCVATGNTSEFVLTTSMRNDLNGTLELRHSCTRAPKTSPVVTLLGTVQTDLPLAGLCAKVLTAPLASVPMGTSGATGSVSTQTLQFTDNASWWGTTLYFQAYSPDAGQSGAPIVLSQGERQVIPDNIPKTNSGPWGGGIVAQFEY